MNEPADFLKFLINEDIYVIDEKKEIISTGTTGKEHVENTEVIHETSLVQEPVETLAPPNKQVHEILILFDNPSADDLPTADMEYLGKILGAIGQSNEKVDFLNLANETVSSEGYKHIIAFTPNHQLPIDGSTQQYVAVKFGESKLIIADALNNISASTDLRKKLWGVLQEVFKG